MNDPKDRVLFLRKAEQVSSPINLVSGEFYFMEAIMKAGSNPSDHLGVGVRQPNGNKYQPILNPDLYREIPGTITYLGVDGTLCNEAGKKAGGRKTFFGTRINHREPDKNLQTV